jgi:membrane protein DedA with SNARE-associated domain
MFHLATAELTHFLVAYGYWAVLLFVAIESTGIPFPGETMLLVAASYARETHRLAIPLVIAAAALGAIVGDNLGYWVGREGGYRLLRRYGRYIRLDERKMKLGQYLFRKYGGKVVFFGRFIAILRAWAAFLAGVNWMPWGSFLLYNALGGIIWATFYGLGGYFLGNNLHRLTGPVGTHCDRAGLAHHHRVSGLCAAQRATPGGGGRADPPRSTRCAFTCEHRSPGPEARGIHSP